MPSCRREPHQHTCNMPMDVGFAVDARNIKGASDGLRGKAENK